MLLEKTRSEGLLQDEAPNVNTPSCEQPVQSVGKTPHPAPTHLVLRWRGGGAPTVQPFVGHDVTMAYIIAEGMIGLRDGDAVILYALHWSQSGWGRA